MRSIAQYIFRRVGFAIAILGMLAGLATVATVFSQPTAALAAPSGQASVMTRDRDNDRHCRGDDHHRDDGRRCHHHHDGDGDHHDGDHHDGDHHDGDHHDGGDDH